MSSVLAFLSQTLNDTRMPLLSPFRYFHQAQKAIPTCALLLLVSTLPLHARVSFDALQRDGYGMVALERPEPNVLAVLATINGRKARLVVDTGWGEDGLTVHSGYLSALHSPGSMKQIGYSASGKRMGAMHRSTADVVSLGNVQMRQVPIYCGSLGALEHSSNRKIGADGFLGSGFLQTCSAIVDLHNLRLYLRPPGTGRRAIIGGAMKAQGLSEIPLTFGNHNCFVPVEINGNSGTMIVDTGASFAGVDQRYLEKIKLAARTSRVQSIDATGTLSRTGLTELKSFHIAGVPVYAPDLRSGRFGFYDHSRGAVVGLLGMDILGKNGSIIDFGQKKLYLYGLPGKKSAAPNQALPPAKVTLSQRRI